MIKVFIVSKVTLCCVQRLTTVSLKNAAQNKYNSVKSGDL